MRDKLDKLERCDGGSMATGTSSAPTGQWAFRGARKARAASLPPVPTATVEATRAKDVICVKLCLSIPATSRLLLLPSDVLLPKQACGVEQHYLIGHPLATECARGISWQLVDAGAYLYALNCPDTESRQKEPHPLRKPCASVACAVLCSAGNLCG